MLLLGVIQAQASGAVAAGSFDLLETQVLSSSAASVSFTGLSTYAADYQHLQIRGAVRTTRADTSDTLNIRLNGDTGSNYSRHRLYGNGSSVTSDASTSASAIGGVIESTANNSAANNFGAFVLDLLDPFETTKYSTLRILTGRTVNDNSIQLTSGLWMNTASLTSVQFYSGSGNINTGSRFSLYGLRKAA